MKTTYALLLFIITASMLSCRQTATNNTIATDSTATIDDTITTIATPETSAYVNTEYANADSIIDTLTVKGLPFTINGLGGTIIFGGTSSFNTTGALTVQNGFMRLNDVVLSSPTTHVHRVGDLTMTGGTIDFSDKDFQPNLTVILNVSGNYAKTGGAIMQTNHVVVNGS